MRDLVGLRFGRWVVVKFHEKRGDHRPYWICNCDCGTKGRSVSGGLLTAGHSKSCGCARKETLSRIRFRHGAVGTLTYTSYAGMMGRCYCQGNDRYKWYGARGIMVCARWRGKNGFNNFLSDMGVRPSKNHSIDRINVNKNYEPNNCRWVTHKQQHRNKRNTLFVNWKGERKSLKEVCEIKGIPYYRTWHRVVRFKWPIEKAIAIPAYGKFV